MGSRVIIMRYKCEVINGVGKSSSKYFEALDEQALLEQIKRNDLFLVKFKTVNEAKAKSNKKMNNKEMVMFCRQMGIMLQSGITITKALEILESKATGNAKAVYGRLYESIQIGNPLSVAMRDDGIFEELFINMVEAGERSGALEKNFEKMSEHYEKQNKINNKVKQALMYPMILSIITVLVVIFLVTQIVPTFAGMYEGHDLPWPTQFLMNLSTFLRTDYVAIIGVLIAIVILFKASKKVYSIRKFYDNLKMNAPIVGKLNKTIYSATCARSFASLYSSGLGIVTIMEIISKVLTNVIIRERFLQVVNDLQEGESISVSLEKVAIFDPMLISMVYIGEESGKMGELLDKAADYFDEEADTATGQLVGLLEPIIIVIMAIVIGFIIIAIVMPMYGMMQYV